MFWAARALHCLTQRVLSLSERIRVIFIKVKRDGDRSLQLLIVNEEFLVSASHQLALITSLPFVHTARRYYRLNGLVRSLDRRCAGRKTSFSCWETAQTWSFRGSKSRNKVSVGEPAEGSFALHTTCTSLYMYYTVNRTITNRDAEAIAAALLLTTTYIHQYSIYARFVRKNKQEKTSNGGSLGSCIDEERCQLRKVMWIAELIWIIESLNANCTLLRYPQSMPVWASQNKPKHYCSVAWSL